MEPKEKLLQNYVDKGFLLHGSPYYIEGEIEPSKSSSDDFENSKPLPKLEGVYATTLPLIAIFRAITSKERVLQIKGDYETRYSWDGTSFEATENAIRTLDSGFVYIVARESFRRLGQHVYLSTQPIKPLYRISVSQKDFKKEIKILARNDQMNVPRRLTFQDSI